MKTDKTPASFLPKSDEEARETMTIYIWESGARWLCLTPRRFGTSSKTWEKAIRRSAQVDIGGTASRQLRASGHHDKSKRSTKEKEKTK